MEKITILKADVKNRFEGHWQDFFSHYAEIKSSAGLYHKIVCPFHSDSDPSLSFRSDTGLWKCFGCKKAGDPFTFYGLLKNISSFPEILQGIASDFNIQPSGSGSTTAGKSSTKRKSKIVAEYDYIDRTGSLLYQSVRKEPGPNGKKKTFLQRRPDGNDGWIWNMEGVERVLYRESEVLQAERVLLPEGEKDVDNLRDIGFTATTNVGGAGKWGPEYNEALAGRDVVILPDRDDPGRKHAQEVARSIHGVARSVKVLELPGFKEKQDVSDWIQAGGTKEELEKMIAETSEWEPEENPEETAKSLFPRGPFPWGVLPSSLADSLKQLARSCASSATSLPSAAIAIFASVIGSIVSISPKRSWLEFLIFWFCDIRFSGDGKTPGARLLCRVLHECQVAADEAYKAALEEWQSLPKKDRGWPPNRPRGYFVTNLTLEGLREDHSGHGGKVCILDELSAFISGQNEYKTKGSDRESWLCLHDGQPARIVRAGKSVTLSGARISIFGGIQPQVWKRAFSGEDYLYLIDGTVFRFLPTYEGSAFFPLTAEAWSDENREAWESLLRSAMSWADRQQEAQEKKTLCLDQEAQQAFLSWRNELMQIKEDLPVAVRGFIPKLVGYSLRFAGVLYLMDVFSRDQEPGSILNISDMQKGIRVSAFYLGHIIQAMEAIVSEDIPEVAEVTEQTVQLAGTLEAMRSDLDNGRLAVGYIQERFNETCDKGLRVRSPHLMGSMLRKCGLSITGGRYQANGRAGVHCLVWDKKTDAFIENSPNSPRSPQAKEYSGSPDLDNSNPKSKKSIDGNDGNGEDWTTWTTNGQSPKPESLDNSGFMDNLDNLDNFSNEEEKEEAPELVEI